MNQSTDPLLIELARADYTCPAARDALHDYWEDRGIPQPLAIRHVPYLDSLELWARLRADQRACVSHGPYWVDELPAIDFVETEFQVDIVWERNALDLLASHLHVPLYILHGPIG